MEFKIKNTIPLTLPSPKMKGINLSRQRLGINLTKYLLNLFEEMSDKKKKNTEG